MRPDAAGPIDRLSDQELAELVREANKGHGSNGVSGPEAVRRFAELVAEKARAAERERCAKLCESAGLEYDLDWRYAVLIRCGESVLRDAIKEYLERGRSSEA
jgi:hypothetical protein